MEIIDVIESYKRKEQSKIYKLFLVADVIANRVAQGFSKEKIERLMPWDVYPDMFKDEKISYEKAQQKEELEAYKERRRRAMDNHNARHKYE